MVRDVIHVASVKHRALEPGYAYVRIAHFQSRTTEDLLKAVGDLKKENDVWYQGPGAGPAQRPRGRPQQRRGGE